MATSTARLGLYKPADTGAENINVTTDLNNNWDTLDSKVGVFPCTSGTRPGVPYDGQMIYETDTNRAYMWTEDGDVWLQMVMGNTDFLSSLSTNGLDASGPVDIRGGTPTNNLFTMGVDGEGGARFYMQADSVFKWGSGGGTVDTNLYRAAANQLKTDDAFFCESLDVQNGADIGTNLLVGNSVIINGATYRNRTSAVNTVANTTTEGMLASLTIPANDAAAGAIYRIKAWGTAAVLAATTPTMTFRARMGGTGGASMAAAGAITIRSGMTDGQWEAEFYIVCATTGGSGTWSPMFKVGHNFVTSATTYAVVGPITAASVTRDTTVSNDMVITGQWSAASSSNTITCRGVVCERVG